MTQPTCPRSFETEALRDGRLTGAERSSFERHLATCAVCAREAAALDALTRALRSTALTDVESDELKLRRERTRLLAAFDQTLVRPRGPWLGRGALWACCAVLTLMVGGFVLWRRPGEPQASVATASTTSTTSSPVIRADASARWSRHTRAGRELVMLEHGELWIRTQQKPGQPGFSVMLPDGELEDIGTTFSVAVLHGRTERVHVEEGSVLLKLRGRAPVMLAAGRSWQAQPAVVARHARDPEVSAPSPEVAPSLRGTPPLPSTPAQAPRATPPSAPAAPKASNESGNSASNEFRAALAAFNAGESSEAALKFRRFGEQHPADPRAEDAAYLRVLALERAGDVAGRRTAARAYLQSYPAGFRRTEVERLAR